MFQFSIVLLCLMLNAILSCIEMAFVTVPRPLLKKLAEKGSLPALRVLNLKKNPERVLSVLQIGITLVGAISAAVSGAGAEEHLSPILMNRFLWSEQLSDFVSIAVVVLPLTYFSVVIGELVPKSLALKYPLKFSLWGGMLLIIMDRVFSPFVFVLELSTRFLTQFIFAKFKSETVGEVSEGIDIDGLSDSHRRYVLNLIEIDKRKVKDVMLGWEHVSRLNFTDHYHDILDKIRSSRHTRFPILKEGMIVGLLHAKEFVSEAEIAKLDWTTLIHEVLVLSANESLVSALKKLQTRRSHMAIVKRPQTVVPTDAAPTIISLDAVLGIVTIEDIIEEVVGDIFDEDDSPRTLLSINSRVRTMNVEKNKK